MRKPINKNTSRNNVFKYIRHDFGKNVDLRPFLLKPADLVGVVLHDEAGPLRLAIDNLQDSHKLAFRVSETDSAKRLKGWAVDSVADGKRVVLLETDMGSMNASIAIHELAAALPVRLKRARRIIKIGTCGGLHAGQPTGAIIVPNGALDDEGASKWNTPTPYRLKKYKQRDLTLAHPNLTRKWFAHLDSDNVRERLMYVAGSNRRADHPLDWWPRFSSEHRVTESAIWAIDTFHGRRMHPESFDEIDHHYKKGSVALVGVDNECNSHFSACSYLGLRIAAGLVVSWSREQVLGIARTGVPDRQPWEKNRVHALETELIVQAVKLLLR